MEEDFKQLNEKLLKIYDKRWIKGVNNLTNGAGLTLEKELAKKYDSSYFPDYYGIEIKSTQRYSRYPIILFTMAPEGKELYEMNRLLEKYGKEDLEYSNKKILITNLYTDEYMLVNEKYFFKLDIDYKEKRIYLKIFDTNYNLIEKETYISFNELEKRVSIKLAKLALVYASKKQINEWKYFRYYKFSFYKLKNASILFRLIEENII